MNNKNDFFNRLAEDTSLCVIVPTSDTDSSKMVPAQLPVDFSKNKRKNKHKEKPPVADEFSLGKKYAQFDLKTLRLIMNVPYGNSVLGRSRDLIALHCALAFLSKAYYEYQKLHETEYGITPIEICQNPFRAKWAKDTVRDVIRALHNSTLIEAQEFHKSNVYSDESKSYTISNKITVTDTKISDAKYLERITKALESIPKPKIIRKSVKKEVIMKQEVEQEQTIVEEQESLTEDKKLYQETALNLIRKHNTTYSKDSYASKGIDFNSKQVCKCCESEWPAYMYSFVKGTNMLYDKCRVCFDLNLTPDDGMPTMEESLETANVVLKLLNRETITQKAIRRLKEQYNHPDYIPVYSECKLPDCYRNRRTYAA